MLCYYQFLLLAHWFQSKRRQLKVFPILVSLPVSWKKFWQKNYADLKLTKNLKISTWANPSRKDWWPGSKTRAPISSPPYKMPCWFIFDWRKINLIFFLFSTKTFCLYFESFSTGRHFFWKFKFLSTVKISAKKSFREKYRFFKNFPQISLWSWIFLIQWY